MTSITRTHFTGFARAGLFAGLLAAVLLTGCATSREVVSPLVASRANPTQGQAVRIGDIQDARQFELAPRSPATPSLMDGKIDDETLRHRAIARKRNGYGMALGDVLLPPGQTVSTLTAATLTRVLQDNGYRVVGSGDPDYARAVPVTARVDKLWAWLTPGFASLKLQSLYDITVTGSLPALQSGLTLKGQVQETMLVPTSDDWSAIVTKALGDFSRRLTEKLPAT